MNVVRVGQTNATGRDDDDSRQPTADSLQLTASVEYGIRNTPERLAVSRKPIADSVGTVMTSRQLAAAGWTFDTDAARMAWKL